MQSFTRRASLAASLVGVGLLVAGTVASVTLRRKPAVATPIGPPDAPVPLQSISVLQAVDPPAPPPPAGFLDADGATHTLAEFAGKGLIVNLWATWCVPCVAEMPALQTLAKNLAGDGILVLPLSSDRGGAAVVKKFYAAHGIAALPVWLDPKGEAARAWGARGLPTTLIIDRQGREHARLEGAVDWSTPAALAEIRKLIAG